MCSTGVPSAIGVLHWCPPLPLVSPLPVLSPPVRLVFCVATPPCCPFCFLNRHQYYRQDGSVHIISFYDRASDSSAFYFVIICVSQFLSYIWNFYFGQHLIHSPLTCWNICKLMIYAIQHRRTTTIELQTDITTTQNYNTRGQKKHNTR